MEKLINWSELARLIGANEKNTYPGGRIAKKHKPVIENLLRHLKEWQSESLPEKRK
jgi:hypothetical protein